MQLKDLLELLDPEMEIKIIAQKHPVIPCMTVDKLIGKYACLLDWDICLIDYCHILKKMVPVCPDNVCVGG